MALRCSAHIHNLMQTWEGGQIPHGHRRTAAPYDAKKT